MPLSGAAGNPAPDALTADLQFQRFRRSNIAKPYVSVRPAKIGPPPHLTEAVPFRKKPAAPPLLSDSSGD
ncbi:MAG: hypothetical protein QF471_00050 [Phycisphaerales bacterium]|jgi:hypothetical protein|nr:hypothetical protein [Phycisphaerales bacterium]